MESFRQTKKIRMAPNKDNAHWAVKTWTQIVLEAVCLRPLFYDILKEFGKEPVKCFD